MPGSVAVVKEMLGHGVVDGDNRIVQGLVGCHGVQTDDTRGGFFRSGDDIFELFAPVGVQHVNQVRPVIHGEMRTVVDGRVNVLVIGNVVFTFDGIHGDLIVRDQRGSHFILRGKRVRGGQYHIRAAGLQGLHQICGFRGHVQTG